MENCLLTISIKNYVIDNLEPENTSETETHIIKQERFLSKDHQRINKKISIYNKAEEANKFFEESVRMYELIELEEMFKSANLEIEETYGDFRQSETFNKDSKRLLILAKAT